MDIKLGHDLPLAVLTACLGDGGNAIEHQHRRQRKLCVAWAKELAPPACQQILETVVWFFLKQLLPCAFAAVSYPFFGEYTPYTASRSKAAGRRATSRWWEFAAAWQFMLASRQIETCPSRKEWWE